jgi:hypothetical protein
MGGWGMGLALFVYGGEAAGCEFGGAGVGVGGKQGGRGTWPGDCTPMVFTIKVLRNSFLVGLLLRSGFGIWDLRSGRRRGDE